MSMVCQYRASHIAGSSVYEDSTGLLTSLVAAYAMPVPDFVYPWE